MKKQILLLATVTILVPGATAAGSDFFERFTAASQSKHGFLSDGSLVQTNDYGPILTNAPISWAKLTTRGELSGVKLGMTMSEVVEALGKPQRLHTYCSIGPVMGYCYRTNTVFGDFSLTICSNRVVRMEIRGEQAKYACFDNGLAGKMNPAQCESLLGAPAWRHPDTREGFIAKIAYRSGEVLTEIGFTYVSPTQLQQIQSIVVSLEHEVARQIRIQEEVNQSEMK